MLGQMSGVRCVVLRHTVGGRDRRRRWASSRTGRCSSATATTDAVGACRTAATNARFCRCCVGLSARDRDRPRSRRPPRAGGGGDGCRGRVGGRRRAGRRCSRRPKRWRGGWTAWSSRRWRRCSAVASSPSGGGYRSTVGALVDLVGWDRFEAHRGVVATEQVCPAVSVWTARCCRRGLPATAAVFADCLIGLRHVEVVTKILGSEAAGRLAPEVCGRRRGGPGGARRTAYAPPNCAEFAVQLITALDQNGPEPRDDPPPVNGAFPFS